MKINPEKLERETGLEPATNCLGSNTRTLYLLAFCDASRFYFPFVSIYPLFCHQTRHIDSLVIRRQKKGGNHELGNAQNFKVVVWPL